MHLDLGAIAHGWWCGILVSHVIMKKDFPRNQNQYTGFLSFEKAPRTSVVKMSLIVYKQGATDWKVQIIFTQFGHVQRITGIQLQNGEKPEQ